MQSVREQLHIFVRKFGLLNASCCDDCCGEQISMVQSHILFELRRMGLPSIQQLAEEIGMDLTTFSRQVKSMEGKGLITRRVSPEDRRVSLLSLTPHGIAILEQIDSYMANRLELIFAFMTPFEKNTVVNSLVLLNEAVSRASTVNKIA